MEGDIVIPEAENPGGWDRYAYVINNPLYYTDPLGYCGVGSTPGEGISQTRHDRLCLLHDEAMRLSILVQNGDINDVEALALLFDYAAPLYTYIEINLPVGPPFFINDGRGFITDIGIIIGGIEVDNNIIEHGLNLLAGAFDPAEMFRIIKAGDEDDRYGQYYIGYDAFTNEIHESGMKPEFSQGTANQVRHFVGGLVGGSAFLGLGRSYQYNNEEELPDKKLYEMSYSLVDYLIVNPVSYAGNWVRENLERK